MKTEQGVAPARYKRVLATIAVATGLGLAAACGDNGGDPGTPTNDPSGDGVVGSAGAEPTIASFTVAQEANCVNGAGQITLSWELGGGATGATIAIDGPGIYDTYPGTSHTEQFPGACSPGDTQTYLLTTIGGTGDPATATIQRTAPAAPPPTTTGGGTTSIGPQIDVFTAVGGPCVNGQVTLHWELSGGATGASISIDDGGVYNTYDGTNVTESFPGACGDADDTQKFTLTTIGGGNPVVRSITVTGLPFD